MMKRFSAAIFQSLFLFAILWLANWSVYSQTATPFSINNSPLSAPTSPVMDYAGVLDANTKRNLEQKIIAFRDSTNPKVELAVAIINSTDGREIFDYSLAVARGWKIGSKEQDNPSALLVVAVNDRKAYTQVSRDLEDELPDGLVGQLQRRTLVPAFREQNYGKGISDLIDAYINQIRNKGNAEVAPPTTGTTERRQSRGSMSICTIGICLIVLIFIILPILSRSSKRKGRGRDDDDWGGGGFGGGASSALPWVIGSILANSGSSSGSSSSSDWGGSSGGGSDWGGFGGGGDFGGGGAGVDW